MTDMFAPLILTLVAAYMALLFAVAWRSERVGHRPHGRRLGPWAYALSLAIYCTSWTYYGAVGTAARDGWDYLPIYLGPVIGLVILFPLWRRIAAAAKRENIGSIADFISSRYGKSPSLGALVACVAIVGSLLVTVGVPVHMFAQLKVAYGLSWFSAAWRTLFLLLFCIFAFTLFLLAIIMLGLTG